MKATLFSAKLGSLILTNQRPLFLSSGSTDAMQRAARAASTPVLGMHSDATAHLDLSALANPGSLEIPLSAITACKAGRKRALIVTHTGVNGEESHAFGQQMGMPYRDSWVEHLQNLTA